jgi:hypothetical protein
LLGFEEKVAMIYEVYEEKSEDPVLWTLGGFIRPLLTAV